MAYGCAGLNRHEVENERVSQERRKRSILALRFAAGREVSGRSIRSKPFPVACSGEERPDLARRYWQSVLWSPSYFAASCGSAPRNILKNYIEQHKKPR
ncbi:MAG: hypothetical protein DMG56_22775 [Acidobacteria bacterium]|nr:MAG: hypothetical protein DMG54_16105 [Acidobacteriota bacterium]PYU50644.1 MAG: hypothetical protein DMG53_02800 [Acidobacteriota bacterium]PYU56558.1 MAG: hypothetical protein DMG55_23530 [Acidobacteriota bacterium]PYU57154.1 MAG: hypothetical protein DMG56_22775 [Acidobacteriota bacterium]PYU71915.1 MAG: hypothetical protein DMG52_20760 [Acidobacteriota bacterium]